MRTFVKYTLGYALGMLLKYYMLIGVIYPLLILLVSNSLNEY